MFKAVFLCLKLENSVRLEVLRTKEYLEEFFSGKASFEWFEVQSLEELEEISKSLSQNSPDIIYACGLTVSRAILRVSKELSRSPNVISLFIKNPVKNRLIRKSKCSTNRCVTISTTTFSNTLIVDACFALLPKATKALFLVYGASAYLQTEQNSLRKLYEERRPNRKVKLLSLSQAPSKYGFLEQEIIKTDFVVIPITGIFDQSLKRKISDLCIKHKKFLVAFPSGIGEPISVIKTQFIEGYGDNFYKVVAAVSSAMAIGGKTAGEIPSIEVKVSFDFYLDEKMAEKVGALHFPEMAEYIKCLSRWGHCQDNMPQVFDYAEKYLNGGSDRQECIEFFKREIARLKEKIEKRHASEVAKVEDELAALEALKSPQSIKVGILSAGEGAAHELIVQKFKNTLSEQCQDTQVSVEFLEASATYNHEYPEIIRDIIDAECNVILAPGFKPNNALKNYIKEYGALDIPIIGGCINRFSSRRLSRLYSNMKKNFIGIFFDVPSRVTLVDELLFHFSAGERSYLLVAMKEHLSPEVDHEIKAIQEALTQHNPDLRVDLHIIEKSDHVAKLHDIVMVYDAVIIPEGSVDRDTASYLFNTTHSHSIEIYGSGYGKQIIISDWGSKKDFENCGTSAASLIYEHIIQGVPLSEMSHITLKGAKSYSGNREKTTRPSGVSKNDFFVILENSIRYVDDEK